jgi:hypothetical protein
MVIPMDSALPLPILLDDEALHTHGSILALQDHIPHHHQELPSRGRTAIHFIRLMYDVQPGRRNQIQGGKLMTGYGGIMGL